jgi:hypothetical protein
LWHELSLSQIEQKQSQFWIETYEPLRHDDEKQLLLHHIETITSGEIIMAFHRIQMPQ